MSDQITANGLKGIAEEFSPLKLRQIKWGLLEYFLENQIIGKRSYGYWINRTLNENKHLLSKDEHRLLEVSAELNEHDPWNWAIKNHVPPNLDKIRVYEKYVSIVIPRYKIETSVEDLYISTCNTLARFGDLASTFTDRPLLSKAAELENTTYYSQRNPYYMTHEMTGGLLFFKAIEKTPFLMVYRFDFLLDTEHYCAVTGSLIRPTVLQDYQILPYLSRLPSDKIGELLVCRNIQTGLLVPEDKDSTYYGVLQTREYETNLAKLYFKDKTDLKEEGTKGRRKKSMSIFGEDADLIFAKTGSTKRSSSHEFYKLTNLSNFKKFVAQIEGPVL